MAALIVDWTLILLGPLCKLLLALQRPVVWEHVVLFATVDDVPHPSAVAPLEGRLLLSSGRQARGLRSLLVPSYRGGRLIGGLLCGARLVGSG